MPVIKSKSYSLTGGASWMATLADATTYYISSFTAGFQTDTTYQTTTIPRTGYIRNIDVTVSDSAPATAEAWSMYFRNITTGIDYLIATVSTSAVIRSWINNNLNIPVTAGDRWCIKTTTPTWVSNPSDDYAYITLIVGCA